MFGYRLNCVTSVALNGVAFNPSWHLTNAAGFILQSTTNLVSPAVWSAVSPGPIVVNGQNAVTNPISGTKKFYRLIQ